MMDFLEKINQRMMPMLGRLTNLPYIMAIRDGMISTIPLTIAGSFFLIFAFPPVPSQWFENISLFQWIAENRLSILIPFRATMGMISIFVVYNTAASLAKAYSKTHNITLDSMATGTLALVAFFITQNFVSANNLNGESLGLVISLENLGSAGLFVGILTSFITTEIYRFFKQKDLIIKMPDSVPPAVARSFEALIPMFVIILIFGSLHILPKIINPEYSYINLHTIIGNMFGWLAGGVDSLGGALLLVFFICLLWISGVHGMAVIGAIARPVWLMLLDKNSVNFAEGIATEHIFVEPFYQWFVWIGGAGSTLGLLIAALIVAKSPFIRSFSKTAFIPSLFNINEPVMFGLPVVLNPVLGIPFIIAPMVQTIITWFAMQSGLVPTNVILAPWTFPFFIGAYISTGGSITAAILAIFNVVVSTLIYLPFVMIYDKQQLSQENI
ncbi:MAG: PTS sugar transporter subunit IIC [Brevinema sp.]